MNLEIIPQLSTACSSPFQPAAQLYQQHNPAEAYAVAMKVFRDPDCDWSALTENDWLLLSAICKASGESRRHTAMHKLGFQHRPQSKLLGAMYAWDLSASRRYFEARDLLEKLAADADESYSTLVVAVQTYNYSDMGWKDTAAEYHERVIGQAADNPMSLYVLARAAARRRQWSDAATLAKRVYQLAPAWPRANFGLIDALLAVDDYKSARELLHSEHQSYPHVGLQSARAIAFESLGEIENAIACYEQALKLCSNSKYSRAFGIRLAILKVQQGDTKSAQLIISKYKLEEFVSVAASDNSARTYLPLPLVSQASYHCVPTVAAMVAGAQGVSACPATYAAEMGTQDGTQIWQMVDYMKAQGFAAYCVRPEVDVVKAILDQGVPLIGQLPSLFSGHVDSICGYDDQLEVFYSRDPDHWHGSHLKYASLAERYEGSISLIAFVAPDRIADVEIKDAWLNAEVEAFIDLSRAASYGRLSEAEAAHAKIGEDHPLAFTAARRGRLITITDGAFQKSVKAIVDRCMAADATEKAFTTETIQALLQFMNADNADEIRAITHRHREHLRPSFIKYVKAECLMAKGDWQSALTAWTELAWKSPSSEQLWSQLANVQRQLGMREAAEESEKIVLEISPNSDSGNRNKLSSQQDILSFEQRAQQATALVEKYSANPTMRLSLASVMASSGNGKDYEDALKACAKFYPRYQYPYESLANWYLSQERDDLACKILEQGRLMIGLEEMPLWGCETPQEEKSEQATSEPEATAEEPKASEEGSATDRAWREIGALAELSKEEFEATQPFQCLLKHQQDTKMHWWHSERFLSLRCRNLNGDKSLDSVGDVVRADALRALLPNPTPGVAENFVGQFLERANFHRLSLACRQVILDWTDEVTTNLNRYPDLRFERAFLLETLDRLNEAEAELRDLVKDHPAYTGAIYRLGQIAEQRRAWDTSTKYYQDCLEVRPGHWGSHVQLCDLAEKTGDPRGPRDRGRWMAYPYEVSNISRVAGNIYDTQSPEEAHAFLERYADDIEPGRKYLLHARLHYRGNEYQKTIEILDSGISEENRDYGAEWLRCHCLVELEDYSELANSLKRMDEKWPDDPDTLDKLARALREVDMQDSKKFSREKLVAGNAIYVLGYVCLQQEDDPVGIARSILADTDPSHRAAVAEQLCRSVRDLATAEQTLEFVKHCAEEYPCNPQFRIWLMHQYCAVSSHEEAVKIGEALLAENPDCPEYLDLLADCCEPIDAVRAACYISQSYKITGKVETLVALGVAQAKANEMTSAEATWARVLEIDPVNTYAMTNVMWYFDDFPEKLWENIDLALETQAAVQQNSEYFLPLAVNSSRLKHHRLPIGSFVAGVARGRYVLDYGGFNDERFELGVFLQQCLSQWCCEDPADAQGDVCLPLLPTGFNFEDKTGLSVDEIFALSKRLCNSGEDESGVVVTAKEAVRFHREMAEAHVADRNFDEAAPFFRHCIDNFDETIAKEDKTAIAIGLVEAEKGGAWYDRTADTVGRMFGKKDAKWIGGTDVQNAVICIAFGLAGLSGFCLQSLSVLPPGVLVVGALILTMFSIFIYHQERSSAAAKLLKNYPLEDHSLDLAKLEVSQVPVSVPTPQSVLQ